MIKGRTAVGLCIVCALLVSAFAAQSARAETTAFTCSESVTTKTWSDAHCTNTTGEKKYGHVAIPADKTTNTRVGRGTSKPKQVLRATINGINTELTTESASGEGELHNHTNANKEMEATWTGVVTYTNVTVAAPAGKGCKVYTDNEGIKGEEGVMHTNTLNSVTTNAMGVQTVPALGEEYLRFFIDGCSGTEALEGLNKTYTVTGSVTAEPNGGEAVYTHANTTTQNTLKINGSIKAGMDGSATLGGRDAGKPEEAYKAIAVTTPEGGAYKVD